MPIPKRGIPLASRRPISGRAMSRQEAPCTRLAGFWGNENEWIEATLEVSRQPRAELGDSPLAPGSRNLSSSSGGGVGGGSTRPFLVMGVDYEGVAVFEGVVLMAMAMGFAFRRARIVVIVDVEMVLIAVVPMAMVHFIVDMP